ncbi:MAG: hypothetical protein AAF708_22330, partial [Deinococcota bacterium]
MSDGNNEKAFVIRLDSVIANPLVRQDIAKKLADELGISENNVYELISEAPQIISATMTQEEAEAMATSCRDAGLEVSLMPTSQTAKLAFPQQATRITASNNGVTPNKILGSLPPFGLNSPYITIHFKPRETMRTLL